MSSSLRLLFLADSHLGLDLPVQRRVQRRRRGDDFLANYAAALEPARAGEVDLVVHGGDVFDRSRVPASLAYQALEPLRRIADAGVPVFIVPGNHERSLLPQSRFAAHPLVHVFDRPRTIRIEVRGRPLALVGFPYERRGVRALFPALLREAGWRPEGVVSLLCMHQCVEGATVGPADFVFRHAADVVRGRDIPAGFAAVLSGHIHRHQVLTHDLSGRLLAAPVFYPGSIERTALAELGEPKGYLVLRLPVPDARVGRDGAREVAALRPAAASAGAGAKSLPEPASESGGVPTLPGAVAWEFRPLPARPMLLEELDAAGKDAGALERELRARVAAVPAEAVLTIRVRGEPAAGGRQAFSAARLRAFVPGTMNLEVRTEWSQRAWRERPRSNRPAGPASNGPLFEQE